MQKTKGAINNGQFSNTGNTGHKTQDENKRQKHSTRKLSFKTICCNYNFGLIG